MTNNERRTQNTELRTHNTEYRKYCLVLIYFARYAIRITQLASLTPDP
jgi:hypothetical protein